MDREIEITAHNEQTTSTASTPVRPKTPTKSCRSRLEQFKLQLENDVLQLIYQGYTQVQIAAKMKISQPTVSRIWNKQLNNYCRTRQDYNNLRKAQSIKKINEPDLIKNKLWQIENDKKTSPEVKLKALKILTQYDDQRIRDGALRNLYNVCSSEWPIEINDHFNNSLQ